MSKEQEELRDALRKIKKLVCGDKAPRWANDDAVFDTRGIIADICEIADMPRASLEGVQELEEYVLTPEMLKLDLCIDFDEHSKGVHVVEEFGRLKKVTVRLQPDQLAEIWTRMNAARQEALAKYKAHGG
jgi:hypothetical protein